jgi:prepilin-type N-terminal cleavage/methylation domain-containing protein/prepilin-type processing-associated H-X9-DG protein
VKRKAFTLVELLVVVGIIALLVAILLPALNKARQTATAVQCQSNLRQIGIAFFNYATENHDYIPPHGYAFQFLDGTRGATFYHHLGKGGYLAQMQTFKGPLFNIPSTRFNVTRCPAETGSSFFGMSGYTYFDVETMAGSYVMNFSIAQHAHYVGYGGLDPAKCFRKRFLRGPETMRSSEARIVVDTPDWGAFWVLAYFDYNIDAPFATSFPETSYAYRHPGRTLNALYMDGHVAAHGHVLRTGVPIYQILWNNPIP